MKTNEGILMRRVRDPDPRVRTRAVQSLLENCDAGNFLSLNHYRMITEVIFNHTEERTHIYGIHSFHNLEFL